jgi:hypothetical protein
VSAKPVPGSSDQFIVTATYSYPQVGDGFDNDPRDPDSPAQIEYAPTLVTMQTNYDRDGNLLIVGYDLPLPPQSEEPYLCRRNPKSKQRTNTSPRSRLTFRLIPSSSAIVSWARLVRSRGRTRVRSTQHASSQPRITVISAIRHGRGCVER